MIIVEGPTVVVRVLEGPLINGGDGCMVAAGDGRGEEGFKHQRRLPYSGASH